MTIDTPYAGDEYPGSTYRMDLPPIFNHDDVMKWPSVKNSPVWCGQPRYGIKVVQTGNWTRVIGQRPGLPPIDGFG